MNKKLIVSAMFAAGLLSIAGTAQAFGGSNFESDIEDIVQRATSQYDELLVANIAVNTKEVNASVRIDAEEDLEIGGAYAHLSTDLDSDIEVEVEDRGGDDTVAVTVDIAPELKAQVGSSIKTSAIGAANVGDITVTAAQEVEVDASEYSYESERDSRRHDREVEFDRASISFETTNPDVAVFQIAYNDADIDATVDIESDDEDIQIRNTDINTSAFGALNAGDITVSITTLPAIDLGF